MRELRGSAAMLRSKVDDAGRDREMAEKRGEELAKRNRDAELAMKALRREVSTSLQARATVQKKMVAQIAGLRDHMRASGRAVNVSFEH